MKTQRGEKIFLGLVSCQILNAEDEIISKASREVFFVFEIKIEDGKIVPKFLSDQQGILFTLGARDCLADLTDKHNQFS